MAPWARVTSTVWTWLAYVFVVRLTTEFHAEKPSGWPAGKYKAEVMLNGAVVQSRDYEVK